MDENTQKPPAPQTPSEMPPEAKLKAAAEALGQKLLEEKRSLAWTQFATD